MQIAGNLGKASEAVAARSRMNVSKSMMMVV